MSSNTDDTDHRDLPKYNKIPAKTSITLIPRMNLMIDYNLWTDGPEDSLGLKDLASKDLQRLAT